MLIKRILSSVVIIGLVIAAIFNQWLLTAVIITLTVLGLYEFYTMLEHKGISIYKYFGIGMGAIIPFSGWRQRINASAPKGMP